jgi:hypothetical protein
LILLYNLPYPVRVSRTGAVSFAVLRSRRAMRSMAKPRLYGRGFCFTGPVTIVTQPRLPNQP